MTAVGLLVVIAGCTHPGEIQPVPFKRNLYQVEVHEPSAAIYVSKPPKWRLDPDGSPCQEGSFTHPDYFFSHLMITADADMGSKREDGQNVVHGQLQAEARRSESTRVAEHNHVVSKLHPSLRPRSISRDPIAYERVAIVPTKDGRNIWITRVTAVSSGTQLNAVIPEDGFRVTISLNVHGSLISHDLLTAIKSVVMSYRCESTPGKKRVHRGHTRVGPIQRISFGSS